MAMHRYVIGEVDCEAHTKTAARNAAEDIAAKICRDGVLAPTIVWGCPGQSDPIVVARQVDGFGTFRPGRQYATGLYASREQAIVSACVNAAQNVWGERVDAYGPFHEIEMYAAWIRGFDREIAALTEAAHDFMRWAKWQRGYMLAKHENPTAGDQAWRDAADRYQALNTGS